MHGIWLSPARGASEAQAKMAVVTVDGKAYYRLVSELRRRKVPFMAVNPGETLPLNIAVAVTTESEKHDVKCPIVLTYDAETNPSNIVEEALQIVRGKQRYKNLVIGIDPGKDFGIAVVGDGEVLETAIISGAEDVAIEVLRMLKRFESDLKVVKIGSGAEDYQSRLITVLDRELPSTVDIESVEERGTTKNFDVILDRRRFGDAFSAIKISMRRGQRIARGK